MKPPNDRRRAARELCSDFVQFAWNDQQGRRISYVGILEDVSPEGMCVQSDLPVPVGQALHLHTKGFDGEAQVAYCELVEYGYVIGLEFLDGYMWDREKWRPQHLLAL